MQWFSTAGDFVPLRGHLVKSGKIFDCHKMGTGRWGSGWEAVSLRWGEGRRY